MAPGFAGGDGGGEPVGVVAAGQGGADGSGPPGRPADVGSAVVMRAAGASVLAPVKVAAPTLASDRICCCRRMRRLS